MQSYSKNIGIGKNKARLHKLFKINVCLQMHSYL